MGKSILDPIGKSPEFCVFKASDLPKGGKFDLGWDDDDDDDDDDDGQQHWCVTICGSA